MKMTSHIEHLVTTGDLIAELASRAPRIGGNDGGWPGLTIYRFHEPTEPTWAEIQSLSIGIVAQGRTAAGFPPVRTAPVPEKGMVSALDSELMSVVIRFLQSLGTGADRRVLAPLYVQEMVYRVLQREQFARMLYIAAKQAGGNPVSAALTYVQEHFSEPITVNDMAEQVNLSPSSFSHLFREVTGRSPYQFLKELRLDRARELLLDGRLSVTDVSRAVGYSSASHFIKEFRSRFGTTPRAYVDAQALGDQMAALRQA